MSKGDIDENEERMRDAAREEQAENAQGEGPTVALPLALIESAVSVAEELARVSADNRELRFKLANLEHARECGQPTDTVRRYALGLEQKLTRLHTEITAWRFSSTEHNEKRTRLLSLCEF